MIKYPIAHIYSYSAPLFEYRVVARLAGVSEAFIVECEREELVNSQCTLHGAKGLRSSDVHKLKLIRYLHENMGLPLDAVDFVLRYRDQLKALQHQLDEMEQRLRQAEREHQAEVLALYRKLAEHQEG